MTRSPDDHWVDGIRLQTEAIIPGRLMFHARFCPCGCRTPIREETNMRHLLNTEVETATELIGAPSGAIMLEADGTAWQYDGARWWPANNYRPRRTEELSDQDGPYTLVYLP